MKLGYGGVIAVFLLQFARKIANGDDDCLWVVEGDVPSAYLVTDRAFDPVSALRIYCGLMDEWVEAVENGRSLEDAYPVEAPADREHCAMLRNRINFIRDWAYLWIDISNGLETSAACRTESQDDRSVFSNTMAVTVQRATALFSKN